MFSFWEIWLLKIFLSLRSKYVDDVFHHDIYLDRICYRRCFHSEWSRSKRIFIAQKWHFHWHLFRSYLMFFFFRMVKIKMDLLRKSTVRLWHSLMTTRMTLMMRMKMKAWQIRSFTRPWLRESQISKFKEWIVFTFFSKIAKHCLTNKTIKITGNYYNIKNKKWWFTCFLLITIIDHSVQYLAA